MPSCERAYTSTGRLFAVARVGRKEAQDARSVSVPTLPVLCYLEAAKKKARGRLNMDKPTSTILKCGNKDYYSLRKCDLPLGHDGPHDDSSMPIGSITRVAAPAPEPSAPDLRADQRIDKLARWIWARFVGIPITEPYDKEYNALCVEVSAHDRNAFTAGLRECLKQTGAASRASLEAPPNPHGWILRCVCCGCPPGGKVCKFNCACHDELPGPPPAPTFDQKEGKP